MSAVKISTLNKASRDSLSEFTNTFFQPLEPGKYEIDTVCIPIAWYNVTSSNNTINFYYLIDRTATIPPGVYTASSLATAVKTAMDTAAAGPTFTVTYSTTTQGYTFTISSGTFNFLWSSGGTAYKLLGFSQTNSAHASSVSSDLMVDLANPRSLHISIDPMAGSTYDSKGYVGYVIPITENHGNIMVLNKKDLSRETLTLSAAARTVKVTLRGDSGELINILSDWYIIIKRV